MFEKYMNIKSIVSSIFPMEEDGGGGGGGGGVATEWKNPAFAEQFEESLRSNKGLSQFEGTNDLGKAFIELGETHNALKGDLEGKVKIPDENTTAEEMRTFYKALKVPDKAEEYVINRPEEMPQGMTYNEVFEKDFRAAVHGLNLNQKQAAGMAKFIMDDKVGEHNGTLASIKERKEESVTTLKKDWPGEYYDSNGAQAKSAMLKFAEMAKIENPEEWISKSGFGDSSNAIRLFHAVYGAIGSDYFVPASTGGASDDKLAPGEPRVFASYSDMKKT